MGTVDVDVVVVGAGAMGLSCARALRRRGRSVLVVDQEESVGGQLRTVRVQGSLCDVRLAPVNASRDRRGRLRWVPVERVGAGVVTVSDAGTRLTFGRLELLDLLTLGVRMDSPVDLISVRHGITPVSLDHLADQDYDLTRRRTVEGILRCVAGGRLGEASTGFAGTAALHWLTSPALPRFGAASLAARLADGLATRLGCRVSGIETGTHPVCVTDRGSIAARAIVIATGPVAAARLLGQPTPAATPMVTQWFRVPEPPTGSRCMHLWVDPCGDVTQALVATNVAPHYSPGGVLVGAGTVPGDRGQVASDEVKGRLGQLYATSTDDWEEVARVTRPGRDPARASHGVARAADAAPRGFGRRTVGRRAGRRGQGRQGNRTQGGPVPTLRSLKVLTRGTPAVMPRSRNAPALTSSVPLSSGLRLGEGRGVGGLVLGRGHVEWSRSHSTITRNSSAYRSRRPDRCIW